ncbi:MAG TPA: hypothetical protein VF728_05220 [Nocardioides sp.]|jgi:hypothetical protein
MRTLGVAVLLAVGLAAGALSSVVTDDRSEADGPAAPLAATTPAFPGDRTWTPLPDPDLPPLPADVPLAEVLGPGTGGTDTLAVPEGWRRSDRFANETIWHPHGYPRWTYFLRIEQVSSRHADAEGLRDERVERLDSDFDRPELLEVGEDTLWLSADNGGHLQHSLIGWVDLEPQDGEADLEVAVIGRERDLPGMRLLHEAVRAGARP